MPHDPALPLQRGLAMSDQPFRPKASEMPGQQLPYPAKQSEMDPQPATDLRFYKPAGKLVGQRAIITGGDSGIGRAVALAFALEGADVAIVYNVNDDDAATTRQLIADRAPARTCLTIKADVRNRTECFAAVDHVVGKFGQLDVLVNNAAFQVADEKFEDAKEEDIRRAFDTNILGYMWMAQAALRHLKDGSCIVNTGSIVGLVGIPILIPYACTKAAIHAFTKSLALNLGERNIRVNAVVPGPVWTPNIPGTMPRSEVNNFGHEVALKRPGQPEELAPAYVFLASQDASFVTGALYEVTGGRLSPG